MNINDFLEAYRKDNVYLKAYSKKNYYITAAVFLIIGSVLYNVLFMNNAFSIENVIYIFLLILFLVIAELLILNHTIKKMIKIDYKFIFPNMKKMRRDLRDLDKKNIDDKLKLFKLDSKTARDNIIIFINSQIIEQPKTDFYSLYFSIMIGIFTFIISDNAFSEFSIESKLIVLFVFILVIFLVLKGIVWFTKKITRRLSEDSFIDYTHLIACIAEINIEKSIKRKN